MTVEFLSYIILEKDFDKKIDPYLRKMSDSTRSIISEYFNLNNDVITREKEVVYRLYDNTKVNCLLNKDNLTMVVVLPSLKDGKLVKKLKKLELAE